jgi:hypothetical protein
MAPKQRPPTPQELALADAQHLMQLWMKTKMFLMRALAEDAITRDEEQSFLETKSEISKYQRTLGQKLPANISYAGDRMQEMLRQSISIGHLRGLPRPDKQHLLINWHHVFIHLARAVGALQLLVEGYVPAIKQKTGSGSSLAELKKGVGGGAGSKPAKGPNPILQPKLWIALALIGAAAYVLWKRLS